MSTLESRKFISQQWAPSPSFETKQTLPLPEIPETRRERIIVSFKTLKTKLRTATRNTLHSLRKDNQRRGKHEATEVEKARQNTAPTSTVMRDIATFDKAIENQYREKIDMWLEELQGINNRGQYSNLTPAEREHKEHLMRNIMTFQRLLNGR